MNIKNFKYRYNLMTTLSATPMDLCRVDFNKKDFPVDISNSISLYELAQYFNESYKIFQKDFLKLPELNLGPLTLLRYRTYEDNKYLDIIIKDSLDKSDEALLRMIEHNGVIKYAVVKEDYYVEDRKRTEKVKIAQETIKNYLDFADKNKLLIDSYQILRNGQPFGDGSAMLFSKIYGDLIQGLSKIKLSGGNIYFNGEEFFSIVFELGKELKIDYSSGKIIMSAEEIKEPSIFDDLSQNLYINRTNLPEMYSKEKKLVKERI